MIDVIILKEKTYIYITKVKKLMAYLYIPQIMHIHKNPKS